MGVVDGAPRQHRDEGVSAPRQRRQLVGSAPEDASSQLVAAIRSASFTLETGSKAARGRVQAAATDNCSAIWLAGALDDLDRSIFASRERDENAQTLLRELGSLVRQQKRRIEQLTAEVEEEKQRARSEPTVDQSPVLVQ